MLIIFFNKKDLNWHVSYSPSVTLSILKFNHTAP